MENDESKFKEKIEKRVFEEFRQLGIDKLSQILKENRAAYIEEMKKYKNDPEQSWKPFKGKLIEKVLIKALIDEIEKLGLKIKNGNEIDISEDKLDECLCNVRRSLLVDYGDFGYHLPDVDLVVYNPQNCKAIAFISVKATLRERVAQTAYWSLKMKQSCITKNIVSVFITLDEDKDLSTKIPSKKNRAIAEYDIDRTYVIGEHEIEESNKVKSFNKFFGDFKALLKSLK